MAAVYAELITQTLKNAESRAAWGTRNGHQHDSRKLRLRDYYDSNDSNDKDHKYALL